MNTRGRIFLLCLALPAFSQQSAAPPGHRITLDVVVVDKAGKPVPGLQQGDFKLIDNKQPQPVTSFQAMDGKSSDTPVEAVLLVDRVSATVQNASDVRQQIAKFLGQNGGQLPVPSSFVFFSDSATNIQKVATRDGNKLLADLDQSESGLRSVGRSQGVYGAIERLQMSLNALNSVAAFEAGKPGRKLLIWLSPGWPLLSGPNIQLSSKDQEGLFHTIVDTSAALLKARITLYSIDTLGVADAGGINITYYMNFIKGVTAAKQVQVGDLALQVIVTQTGGRVLNSSNDIGRQIENCTNDANAWYSLTFDAPRADGPNEYHKLDLKIDKPGLTARTRTGYYDQP